MVHTGSTAKVILALCAGTFMFGVGCASRIATSEAPTVSLKPDSASPTWAAPHGNGPGDSVVDAGSFVDKFGSVNDTAPECSEIDFLLESARSACKADSFGEAHALLLKALASVREKADEDKSWADAESYSNDAARIYAEDMPEEYSDSIPDEISMLVFQKQLSHSLDTLKLSAGDSIVLKKLSCQKGISYNFPIQWNDRVYRSLCFFARSKKGSLDKCLRRAAYYRPFMQAMFADSGLPGDLSYLPLIESGFDPSAYSRKHASGIWQFIAPTGIRYGLRKSYWIDERRDPVQSTAAAISYLKKLYNQFSDWPLAIAAYNCGENGVAGALSRSSSGSYWRISLPRETRNYVPEFISALILAKNPECFGYTIPGKDTFAFDAVLVDKCINLQAVADSLGIPAQQLRAMNPHILHWCTPPQLTGVRLYLPGGTRSRFEESFARHPEAYQVAWYSYQVRPGEKLTGISRQFKVPLEAIKSINNLGTACRLAASEKILVPIPVHMSTAQAYAVAQDLVKNEQPGPEKPGKTGPALYRVRAGDTIWELAKLFHVTVSDICNWNNLTDRRIRAGQRLVVRADQSDLVTGAQAAPAATPSPQQSSYAKYQVKKGETLFSIARTLSVGVREIIAWNAMDVNNPVIFAGQNLLYKPDHRVVSRPHEPDTLFYRVCKGDNLYSLASSFSVTVAGIRQANNLAPSSVLKAGDLIRIPVVKRTSSAVPRQYPLSVVSREEHL
jgi:membrane-bound lytic murein transglycosylase D